MKRARAWAYLWLLSMLTAVSAQADVIASVDRNVVNLSETFELRLRVEGAMNAEEPALAPLQKDFEILSTSRNHRISLMQGQRESYTEWVVVLLAKSSGQLRIPAISVGSESSAALEITVREGRAAGSTPSGDLSLELLTDAGSVHVQQQVLVTVRLMHAVNLASGASLEELDIPGAVVRKLDEGSHEEIIGGRRFGVFERRYAVFPQKSGELPVPALRFRGSSGGDSWFDRFDTGSRQYRLESAERTIRVLPPEQGASPWIPARNLSVVETWDRDPDALRVGESATRSITLSAEGLTGAQIPPLPDPSLHGVRFYADKPEVSDATSTAGVTGTRVQRVAVIPQQAGSLVFPEMRVRWWDTVHQRFDEAVVPARSLRVLPAAGSALPLSPTPTPAPVQTPQADDTATEPTAPPAPMGGAISPTSGVSPWMISTVASLLLAAFFALKWLRLRRSQRAGPEVLDPDTTPEPAAFSRLQQACEAGDAAAATTALMAWARAAFPEMSLHSAAALGHITRDGEFRAAIDALMASRYAANPDRWEGTALLRMAARHRPGSTRSKGKGDALPALYATT